MKSLLSFFLRNMFLKFAMSKVKKTAAVAYLRLLQVVRHSLIAAIMVFIFLQVMIFGFIGTLVTAVWLWGPDLETKLALLLAIFAICFVLPMALLFFVFSEKFWLKASGALKILSAQIEKPN